MGTRRKSRELVLQMLFQADMGRQTPEEVRRTFWREHHSIEKDVRGFAEDLFRTATDRTAEIDGLIERHAEHWRMDRMATVDRLSALCSGRIYSSFPPRLAPWSSTKPLRYMLSSPESVNFINGVLDSVGRELEKA